MAAQLVEHRVGQHLPRRVVPPCAEIVARFLDPGQHGVENLDGFVDDLRPDAVAGDDRQLHERSTTSSMFAPTAGAIADSTSSGGRWSSRSRIVAEGPSASSESCAAWMFTSASPSSVPMR